MHLPGRRRRRRPAGRAAGWLAAVGVALVLVACSGPEAGPGGTSTSSDGPSAPSSSSSDGPSASVPSSPAPSSSTSPTCVASVRLAAWPLPRLAAQVLMAPAYMDDIAGTAAAVRAGVGGLILFGRTVPADLAKQLRLLSAQAPHGVAPIVSSDEEGGTVQRLKGLVGEVPSARTMAATMTPAAVERLATAVGRRMRAAGVAMDLAPVLDLDDGPGPDATHPDGTRSFSIHRARATAYGLAFARGLRAAGVVPVVKHFPGLGGATGNTDAAPAASLSWTALRASGLRPFTSAITAGMPAVMISNASIPGLTSLPASISPTLVTQVLRHELGFDGLVITDSLSARALSDVGYDVPRAAVAALRAGADIALYGSEEPGSTVVLDATVAAIVSAVGSGRLSRERLVAAAGHVLAAKGVDPCRTT